MVRWSSNDLQMKSTNFNDNQLLLPINPNLFRTASQGSLLDASFENPPLQQVRREDNDGIAWSIVKIISDMYHSVGNLDCCLIWLIDQFFPEKNALFMQCGTYTGVIIMMWFNFEALLSIFLAQWLHCMLLLGSLLTDTSQELSPQFGTWKNVWMRQAHFVDFVSKYLLVLVIVNEWISLQIQFVKKKNQIH